MEFWHCIIIATFVLAYALLISINSAHKKNITTKLEYDYLEEKYEEKKELIANLRIIISKCQDDNQTLEIEVGKLQFENHFLKKELDKYQE